jgi:hypothetical protein
MRADNDAERLCECSAPPLSVLACICGRWADRRLVEVALASADASLLGSDECIARASIVSIIVGKA